VAFCVEDSTLHLGTVSHLYGVLKRNPSRIGAKHGDHFPQANQRRTTISGFEFFGMILRMVSLSPCCPQVEYVNCDADGYPLSSTGLAFSLGLSSEVDSINDLRLEGTRFHPPSKWRIPEWERTFHR
jgi:hypothetical protein